METPPSNVQARNIGYNQNYRMETPLNNDIDEFSRNDFLNKVNLNEKGKKSEFGVSLRQNLISEKEIYQKKLNELRKQIKFVEETNWMFENNEGLNIFENLPNNL